MIVVEFSFLVLITAVVVVLFVFYSTVTLNTFLKFVCSEIDSVEDKVAFSHLRISLTQVI